MKRKILHIVGDSQFGGGAVLILRIAQEAARRGDNVSVLSTDPRFQQAIRESGLTVVDVDCIWRPIRPLRDFVGLWRLRQYLKANHFDIVHTHTSKAGLVGRAAAFYARIPTVVHTVHGFAFHEESSPFAVSAYSWIERLAAKWCGRIVTVSKFHRDWALELGICDPNHIVAIPNGVAPDRITATVERTVFRAELGLAPDEVVLVSAGRLAHQKGIEFLIEAVRILRDGGMRQLRVVLAGDGPLRGFLEQKVKEHHLAREFIFLGFRTDVANILAAGDIAVMPTEREGMSISLLEAMAAGKPVVTTTIGSNLEVTENGKFARLVEPRDVSGLAAAIKDVVHGRERFAAMGQAAQKHFFECYTEQVMLDSYMALYGQLVPTNERDVCTMTKEFIVRPMTFADLGSVARVHCTAFQGFFLDAMGPVFLRAYYDVVLRYRDSIALVAEDGAGQVAGFSVGFFNPAGFYVFLKSRWFQLVLGAAIGVLRRPQLLGQVLMNRSRVSNNSKAVPEAGTVELASIASVARQHGLGSRLMASFIEQAKLRGGARIALTTDLNGNAQVQGFYRKHGFIEKGLEIRGVREMLCFELALDRADAA